MSLGEYVLGVAGLAAIIAPLGLAAVRLRALAVPDWTGAPARLAEAVIGLALLLAIAELLGTVELLKPIPLIAACVVTGLGLAAWAGGGVGPSRREDAEGILSEPPPRPEDGEAVIGDSSPRGVLPPLGPVAMWVAVAAAALVMAHWAIGVQESLAGGMSGFDSQWYHMPFAARFAETGNVSQLHFTAPVYLNWFYPASSELLHGIGIALFSHRDVLSPALNLAWLGLALLAAWCIGRPWGVGAASVVGVAVILDAGVLADQAGEARNDIMLIALLLAAVALFIMANRAGGARFGGPPSPSNAGGAADGGNSGDRTRGLGGQFLAALAAGLAVGTKLNALPLAAVLAIGAVVIAPRAARRATAGTWALGLAAGGAYWYLRNLARAGNPLPWVKSIGPISLPHPDQPLGGREDHSVAHYLTDFSVWREDFFPALHHALGILWPVVPALAVAGVVIALSGTRATQIAAIAAIATAVAWFLNPVSAAGPEGNPLGFESNLRYLAPALAIGLALIPTAPMLRRGRGRWMLLGAFAILLVVADRSSGPWIADYVPKALALGFLVIGTPVAIALLGATGRRVSAVACAVAVGAAAVAVGYGEQRDYVRDRYANPTEYGRAGLNDVFKWAREIEGERIGTNVRRQYPLYGGELSNSVYSIGRAGAHGAFTRIDSCSQWRQAINAGRYRYVITTLNSGAEPGANVAPETLWTQGDPNAHRILSSPPAAVFRIEAPLAPVGCFEPGPSG
jgi:hypothetical protein